ncbi:FecR family protein [Riemerella anatipestifer]|uniref:FecR family protein n=1 Tax=Riemerella anatipestifer TaxID=34085 RepID=A0AAP6LLL1_RIEAN|nr:FecR family protein [Riemerella anatipestifer]MBT0550100.1 FecR family protein [Riemerella anatipestifer]MBT0556921.1 FecR family protein [Riemerella anatipestifer]MBT0560860.1 FecR family protein [Riemerella anatipestifer]MBT0564484.1 FecR family protein [Riemerella anatipestifer]MCO7355603.1 FecR family protein [Riemerella anatipestifer]
MDFEPDFEKTWEQVTCEKNKLDLETDQRLWEGVQRKIHKKVYLKRIISVAAILIPSFMLISYLYFNNPNIIDRVDNTISFTTKKEAKSFQLSDGSIIFLGPHSQVILNQDFGKTNREIDFNGKGKFKISKYKNLPFEVNTNDFKIKVLGTVFLVDEQSAKKKVELLQGKIEVDDGKNISTLLPNEIWMMNQDGTSNIHISIKSVSSFDYQNESFQKVISDLEQKYNVTIQYPNKLKNKKVVGSFSGNLTEILQVICFPFNLNLEKKSEKRFVLK